MSTLDISRQIPPRAKVVVEFGATSDLTARNFLMLQPACRWTIVTMQGLEAEEDSGSVESTEDRITVFHGDMAETSFEAREGFEEVDALLVRAEALEAHGVGKSSLRHRILRHFRDYSLPCVEKSSLLHRVFRY